MAEHTNEVTEKRRGPSVSLLIIGLLTLGVSAWAFVPQSWSAHSGIPLGWIVVLTAIIIGIALVISPRKRR